MASESAEDLEAQKAKDPIPNAAVANDPDKSQHSSEHAAPVSPASVAESDHGDLSLDGTGFEGYDKVKATLAIEGKDEIRPFLFFKMMNELNISNLEADLYKSQRNIIEAEITGQGKDVYITQLEDQLHRYSKTQIQAP